MNRTALLLPLALAALASTPPASAASSDTASYSIEPEVKLLSDQRNRGVSDSLNRPGVQLGVQFAHESGVIALAQLMSISKQSYTHSDGYYALLATGWRFGDPDAWHFGVGVATEIFPGASFDAPHGFDLAAGVPTDFRTTKYDTSYAVAEIGWGALEGRILNVISKNYRGASTGGVCGQILSVSVDPTKALACYARGDQTSRGSWLFDLGYKIPLGATTTLNLHAGLQRIKHFREADFADYSIGLTHQRWGCEWNADWVMPRTKTREVFQVIDGDRLRAVDDDRLVVSVSRRF